MRNKKFLAILMALSFLTISPALAQTTALNQPAPSGAATATPNPNTQVKKTYPPLTKPTPPPGTVNCFDYYHFQSVQVSLGTNTDIYEPGQAVQFKGNLINQNNYPVVDGQVFARISRKDPNYLTEGNYIVDELTPFDNVNLAPNEKKAVSFDWTAPANLAKGDYQADFFFLTGKRFNLGGLPFTNEVVVGQAHFSVQSNNASFISFDRSNTTVNGQKYNQIGDPPQINPGAAVNIVQPIQNTFNQAEPVSVQYDLYFWDGVNEANKISSKTEQVTVPANGSTNLTYAIPQMNDTVYFLKITATGAGQKSIINIRPISNQVHPLLYFPAITKFPLEKGDQETIFSCFWDTSALSTSGSLSVTLQDQKGNQVGDLEYSGTISGDMLGAKKDFATQNNYSWLKLTATLKNKDGKVVDQYQTVYDCSKINSPQCKALLTKQASSAGSNLDFNNPKMDIIYIIIALVLISLIIILVKRKNRSTYLKMLMFFLAGGSFVLLVPKAHGFNDLTVTSSPENYAIDYNWLEGGPGVGEVDGWATILHDVGTSQSGTSFAVGQPITFYYNPQVPTFNATGRAISSPYGAWAPTVNPSPPPACDYTCSGTLVYCSGGGMEWCLGYPECNGSWIPNYKYCSTNSGTASEWATVVTNTNYVKDNSSSAITDPIYGGAWLLMSRFYDSGSTSEMYTSVTAQQWPSVNIVSSNPNVVKCNGLNCTAVGTGTATLTASIGSVSGMSWLKVLNGLNFYSDPPIIYNHIPITFPAPDTSALSWTVTVNPATPTPGVCGPAATEYPATATAFSGNLCNPGTPNPNPPTFPSAGNSVNWICDGLNGGGQSDTCIANVGSCGDTSLHCNGTKYDDLQGYGSNDCTGTGPASCVPPVSAVCNGVKYNDNCGGTNTCAGTYGGSCDKGASVCNGHSYLGTCGETCAGTRDCTWREVAP